MVREQTFNVRIAGINPYVDVPPRVLEALGGGSRMPVLVKARGAGGLTKKSAAAGETRRVVKDSARLRAIRRLAPGGWFRSTLLVLQTGAPRLYLDAWMREAARVSVGDRVQVILRSDGGSREMPIPAVLAEALDASDRAKAAWERLAPSRRREILTYLNFLKTPDALERNVQKTIAGLVVARGRRA